jgi:membrane associated rhomboid family serine protease
LLSGILGGALLHLALFSEQRSSLGGISAGLSALLAVILALLQHSRGQAGWRAMAAPILSWVLLNIVIGVIGLPGVMGQSSLAIAWVAHLGGFVAGLIWLPVLWPHYRLQTPKRGETQ